MSKQDLFKLKYSQSFDLQGIEEADISLDLSPASNNYCTISGTVTDGTDPIPNATVKLFDENGIPFQHTMTNESGQYTIGNVPAGTYTIGTVHVGFRLSEMVALTLSNNDTREVNFTCTPDESLSLGAIAGILSGKNLKGETKPLGSAKITLKDTLNRVVSTTYTADDGEFAFYDLEDGTYSLTASAEGYLPGLPISAVILGGSIANLTMLLIIDGRTYNGTVSGIIRDSNGIAISGCFVGLYKAATETTKETLIATTKTNAEGKYMFGNVVEGRYIVKAKMAQ